MARLCERPGCSDTASVAYGMRPEDLVFWLDVLGDDGGDDVGVLCRRHADSMVVPRGWTLDDLRDPDLHLFRPPERSPVRSRRRRSAARDGDGEQLALGVEADAARVAQRGRTESGEHVDQGAAAHVGASDPDGAVDAERDAAVAVDADDPTDAWTPSFDDGDDLDGLLAARSPLLARAFRGTDRPAT